MRVAGGWIGGFMVVLGVGGCAQLAGLGGDPTLLQPDAGGAPDAGGTDAGGTDASDGGMCSDGTGIDCGGPVCPKCGIGQGCLTGTDCQSGVCTGGACVAPTCDGGTCDAQTLLSGLDNPNSLAVDYWGVYWAEGDLGTIMQADFATETPAMLAGGRSGPQGLGIDPGASGGPAALVWVEPSAGNVMEVTTQTLPATLLTVSVAQEPAAAAVGSAAWFWTALGGVFAQPFGGTYSPIENGTGPGGKIVIVPGGSASCQIIMYSTSTPDVSILPLAYGGCSPNLLGGLGPSVGPAIAGLTADATFVYWTDMGGNVMRIPIVTYGAPTVIAPHQASPSDVAVNATSVYWINQGTTPGTGAVLKAPIAGGAPPVVLASSQDMLRGLFLTATDVYWLSGAKGQGAVNKVPN